MTVAKALEGANLVWQRVNIFMSQQQASTSGLPATSPVARNAFLRTLKNWLATQKGNPKLQYVTFTDPTGDMVTTAEISTGGCTMYALFAKKQNTATDAYLKINDHATTAGGANGSNMKFCLPFLERGDEIALMFQPGYVFATGIAVASETTAAGGADTVTGDGANGFAIVG